jgi:anti-anti-sigma factor
VEFEETRVGDVLVLAPKGDMDATRVLAYEARLRELVQRGARALVWDLSAVAILPSTALGFLAANARQLQARGGRFAVVAPSRLVRSTLSTLGLEGVLRVKDTLADALRAVEAP